MRLHTYQVSAQLSSRQVTRLDLAEVERRSGKEGSRVPASHSRPVNNIICKIADD